MEDHKLFATLCAVFCLLLVTEVYGQINMEAFRNCIHEHSIEQETLKEIIRSGPKGRNQKCFTACAFTSFGVIKNEQISIEGCRKMVRLMHQTEEVTQKLYSIVNTCEDEVISTDTCEMAGELVDCLFKNGVRLGE
ncbi:hypothetical protein R5R35_011529 [Gryllus longicercus]|uniref:Odorant binding protein n=1 Tax=Gryllus longicercus TaxID=2509291 RepID=A0AAN9Z8E4_9ORTH